MKLQTWLRPAATEYFPCRSSARSGIYIIPPHDAYHYCDASPPCRLAGKKNTMKTNMGPVDRTIRFLIAVTLIALYYAGIISGIVGGLLIALSTVFLLTSL